MTKQISIIMLLMLVACSSCQATEVTPHPVPTPSIIMVEVTRLVTPPPQPLPTSIIVMVEATRLVTAPPPTPTAAPTADGCYADAMTQWTMNKCSAERRDDANQRMKNLVTQVQAAYRDKPQDAQEFARLQANWEDWVKRECEFRWTRFITGTNGMPYYEHGSWAPMQGNECLVSRYESRIQELLAWHLFQP